MKKDKTYYEQIAPYDEYLKWYQEQDQPNYEKPSITNDSVILAWDQETLSLKFLSIKRKAHPFRGKLALPGGFMNIDESIEDSVIREVKEETNLELEPSRIEQLKTFSSVNRDPRMRIVTVAHLVYMPNYEDYGYESIKEFSAKAGDDALEVQWLTIQLNKNGKLIISDEDTNFSKDDFAFDHWEILEYGMNRIKNRLNYNPTILSILPEYFTATEGCLLFSFFEPKSAKVPNSANFISTYGKFMETIPGRKVNFKKGRPPRYYIMKKMDVWLD